MSGAEPAAVHLWTARLDQSPGEVERMLRELPPDEQERAARYVMPAPRQQFVAGRNLLRSILAGYLAVPPHSLRFVYGPQGKPVLSGRELHFNLAHSHGLLAVAVRRDGPVGVDLERIRPVPQAAAIAGSYFTPAEQRWLGRDAWFFRLWTSKEALVKAAGGGISAAWTEVEVLPDQAGQIHVSRFGSGPWSVQVLTPAPDYVAAVAVNSGSLAVVQAPWESGGEARCRF